MSVTARTLASTQLWLQVHRVGGYVTVGLGAVILIAGLVVTNGTAAGLVLLLAALAAIVMFVSYRKVRQRLNASSSRSGCFGSVR